MVNFKLSEEIKNVIITSRAWDKEKIWRIGLLRSLEKMPPKYAIFSTVLSKIVGHVTARDISRFHSVILCTGLCYNVKSKLSNLESKNTSFVNISSSLHLMLLLMASACSLTLIVLSISAMGKLFKVWVTRSENSAKLSCVICWSNRSRWNSRFVANLLDGDVLLVRQKRNVCVLLCTQSARKNPAWKMKFTNVHDWLLESRKTYKLIFLTSTPLLSLIFH